ncbi:MAG: hypothetical protein Phyf2KO_25350 [Phycisphaerales bacterium]
MAALAQACPPIEVAKLLPSGDYRISRFGSSVAAEGNLLVVGTPFASNRGGAYLFDMRTGEQISDLTTNRSGIFGWYGHAVDIDGGAIVVGAFRDPRNGQNAGAAFVFRHPAERIVSLYPLDAREEQAFGRSIAIDDGVVAVGAPWDNDNGDNAGAVYLFDANTGLQLMKLKPQDGFEGDIFGESVALENGVLAVGAISDDDNGSNSGSVYLFDVSTGEELHKLAPADGIAFSYFGRSVAIDGDLVAVGAERDDDFGSLSGSVYLFDIDSGAQTAKLNPDDASTTRFFGESIAFEDGLLAANGFSPSTANLAGVVYLFDAASQSQIARIEASDGEEDDRFGQSLCIDSGWLYVGADGDDDVADESGAVYSIKLRPADVNNDGQSTPADFSAWIDAFNNSFPLCDQNGDGACTPTDFTAWIANFNSGC